MQPNNGGDEHAASMSALIVGLREHLRCGPLNGGVAVAGAGVSEHLRCGPLNGGVAAAGAGVSEHLRCGPLNGGVAAAGAGVCHAPDHASDDSDRSGENRVKDGSHILLDVSASFDTQADAKMAQKRARGSTIAMLAESTTQCSKGGGVAIASRRGSKQPRGVETTNKNWFNNPCELVLETDGKSDSESSGAGPGPRDSRRSMGHGARGSLLEASRKEHWAEVESLSSSRRSSRGRASGHHRHHSDNASVVSGAMSHASYARDLYSTTSLGSRSRLDRSSIPKSPTIVTFDASVASSTRGKKRRPPTLPKPSKSEPRLPTKLHGLIMDLSGLADKQSAVALWKPVAERVSARPKEAARLDRRSRSPLSLACEFGNDVPVDVIKRLINAHPGAASVPDRKGFYPIHYYVSSDRGGRWNRSAEVLNIIVDAYPDAALKTNKIGQTPLLAAMQTTPSCLRGITSETLKGGKAKGKHSAQYNAREEMLREMYHANPLAASIPDRTYSYPLHYASKRGPNQALLLDLIEQCPAALAARDNFGATPLLLAANWDSELNVLRTLVAACPSAASVRDERGETPLSHLWNSLVHAGRDGSRKDRARTNQARRAINEATSLRSLERGCPEVLERWRKIELLLRASCQESDDGNGSVQDDESDDGNGDADGDGDGDSAASPPSKARSRWLPVHATCGGPAVPPELVRFTMQIFPGEAREVDEMGRLPLHIGASMTGYIRLPFEKKKSRKKPPEQGNSASDSKKSRSQSLLGHLLHEYPKGAATLDHAGRLPLHYAARAGRAWPAIPHDGEEGGIEELVEAEPRAVRTRDETGGMYPFMYLAMRDDQRGPHRSYKERRARAEQRLRNELPSSQEECSEWEAKLQIMLEREEVQEMDTLYRLLRLAPDIMERACLPRKQNSRHHSEERVDVDNPRVISTEQREHAPDFIGMRPFIESPREKDSDRFADRYAAVSEPVIENMQMVVQSPRRSEAVIGKPIPMQACVQSPRRLEPAVGEMQLGAQTSRKRLEPVIENMQVIESLD